MTPTDEEERERLLFSIQRSIRYHRRRSRFFDVWGKITSGLNVVFGSTAVSALLSESKTLGVVAGGLVAVISTIDLVIGSSVRARDYSDLAKRFIGLEAEIERSPPGSSLAAFREKRLLIEADEPPVLRTLDVMCHNEVAKAMGFGRDQMYRVGWVKRRLAHFISFESVDMVRLAPPSAAESPIADPSKTLPS